MRLYGSIGCESVNWGHIVAMLTILLVYVLFIHLTIQQTTHKGESSATTGTFLYFISTYVLLLDPFAHATAPLITGKSRSIRETIDK